MADAHGDNRVEEKTQAGRAGETATGLVEKARDAAGEALHKGKELATTAVGAVRDTASDVAEGVGDAAHAVRERAGDMVDGLGSLIRRNPLPALLLGVGLGFLLGRGLGGR
jgi:ElaB/YqjD/DUF883 family membrane-anchored ribosome-binding protein